MTRDAIVLGNSVARLQRLDTSTQPSSLQIPSTAKNLIRGKRCRYQSPAKRFHHLIALAVEVGGVEDSAPVAFTGQGIGLLIGFGQIVPHVLVLEANPTPLTIGSGTVSNTALSPINDRDTGPYFSGENKFAIAAGGSRVFEATTTSTTIYSPLTAASGLVVGPGGTFSVSSTATFSAMSRFGSTVDTPGSGNTNLGATISNNGSAHFSSDGSYVVLINTNLTENVGISFNRSGSQIGFIYVSTSVRYATSSDYRLKENFEEFTEAQDFVDATPVYKFNWKEKPNAPKIFGFKAHEVQHLMPQAVIGEKDGEDMQAIDHSQLARGFIGYSASI